MQTQVLHRGKAYKREELQQERQSLITKVKNDYNATPA
jgi:hypothetical protein